MQIIKQLLFTAVLVFTAGIAMASAGPIRIACVGNSITAGSNDATAYPQQLGMLLGAGYEVKNFGVGGTTMLKKGDSPYWNQDKFFTALDYNPQIVIIKFGTNDSKEQNRIYLNEFFNDYMDMIARFRKVNKHVQVFVCIPPVVHKTVATITESVIAQQIIPIIDSVQKASNAFLINYRDPRLAADSLSSDGVHPTAAGYAIMGEIAKEAVLAPAPGVLRYFEADDYNFEKNQSRMLNWEARPGSNVKINGAAVADSGSLTVTPLQTTAYTLVTSGKVIDTMAVTLEYIKPGVIKTFKATPAILELGAGDTTTISWSAAVGSSVKFEGADAALEGSVKYIPASTTSYSLKTTGDQNDSAKVTVSLLPAAAINRALGCAVNASTVTRGYPVNSAVDGDTNTVWVTDKTRTQWIDISFDKKISFDRVVIHWGRNFAKKYSLSCLNDLNKSETIYTQLNGDGGIDDIALAKGSSCRLRLMAIDKAYADSSYQIKEIEVYGRRVKTGLKSETVSVPVTYDLFQNYPNPFNPSTVISYQLPVASHVTLKIYDILGNEVASLVKEFQQPGVKNITLNTKNYNMASGVYIYKLTAGEAQLSKKLMLLK
jgi:lysophospholipase L1-like esterase